MIWVLCYDVVEDRRRSRFFKRLKRYMVPVQKSVFEGPLSAVELAKVERLVVTELDLETDSVRLYPMPGSHAVLIRCWGVAAPLPDPDAPLVI
jgi:CRISPR-associated protein Cas2